MVKGRRVRVRVHAHCSQTAMVIRDASNVKCLMSYIRVVGRKCAPVDPWSVAESIGKGGLPRKLCGQRLQQAHRRSPVPPTPPMIEREEHRNRARCKPQTRGREQTQRTQRTQCTRELHVTPAVRCDARRSIRERCLCRRLPASYFALPSELISPIAQRKRSMWRCKLTSTRKYLSPSPGMSVPSLTMTPRLRSSLKTNVES